MRGGLQADDRHETEEMEVITCAVGLNATTAFCISGAIRKATAVNQVHLLDETNDVIFK